MTIDKYFGQLGYSKEYRLLLKNLRFLIRTLQNISSILKTYIISFLETTERCPTLLLKMLHTVPSPSSLEE